MIHFVLLRGLAREAAHWLDFPVRLHEALGGACQLHLIDFPGCGTHLKAAALTSVEAMTEHARAELVDVLGARHEPVLVVGISMGGMVALDWAQRFPDEVRGLVLINSSAGDQPVWWRLRPRALPAILFAFISGVKSREARVLSIVSNNRADYAQHLNQWLHIQQQRPVTRATIATMLRAAARFRPQAQCKVDGLLLASEQDRMVSVRASDALARQFGWPIHHHPQAGHDLPLDDPHWVSAKIAAWCAGGAAPE
ncbi:MAG TPA: alpha/beta hydrolase [Cellvibrio sp.]|nr:alpha/beta hydrolase [Cellvibrio sp.]